MYDSPSMHDVKQLETVMRYHEETKHHFNRYARALGYMDWANQPNPFRRYEGATLGRLPILSPDEEPLSPPYADLYRSGAVSSAPVTIRTLSRLFEYALALSAWKQAGGTRWALRSNPSSGNLHPTEGYLLIGAVPGVAFTPGLYHYAPREHGLERRADCPDELLAELLHAFPPQAFLVGLSSIHWREAWKYGERAFRYCQHDAGHAIATVRYAAAVLGWSAHLIADVSDTAIAAVLGLAQPESFSAIAEQDREHPDALLLVRLLHPPGKGGESEGVDMAKLRDVLHAGGWVGRANSLSPAHVHWSAIDAAAEATWRADRATETGKRCGAVIVDKSAAWPVRAVVCSQMNAVRLVKQRRSCLSLDGITSISAETFYGMLDRLLPRPGVPPLDVWPWPPHLHCRLFVQPVPCFPSGL